MDSQTNLHLLDISLTVIHLLIIGFNLFGWIWDRTKRLHFVCILLTAVCWFILGIWFGIGYCPITDWQWQIKEKLGAQDLPNSFIKYELDLLSGKSINLVLVDVLTAASFLLAALLSVYRNFFQQQRKN